MGGFLDNIILSPKRRKSQQLAKTPDPGIPFPLPHPTRTSSQPTPQLGMSFDVFTSQPRAAPPSPPMPSAGDFQINLQPPSPGPPRTLWASSDDLRDGFTSASHHESESRPLDIGYQGGVEMTRMTGTIPLPLAHATDSAISGPLGGAWTPSTPSTPPEQKASFGILGQKLLLADSPSKEEEEKYAHDSVLDTPLRRSRSIDSDRTIRPGVRQGVAASTSALARVMGTEGEGAGQKDQHAGLQAVAAPEFSTASIMRAMEHASEEDDEALVPIQVQSAEPDHMEPMYYSSSSSSSSEEDMEETWEEEVKRLKREVAMWKSEANKQRREADYAMYALNSHADLIVATIDFPSVAAALLALCGCFPSPKNVAFERRVCLLAGIVGAPTPSDLSQLSECVSIQETFSRALRVLLFSFPPVDISLPNRGRTNLEVFTPPDVLWLFVHTADKQLLAGLKFAAEAMYESCLGSTRGVVLFVVLQLLEGDEKGMRGSEGWQSWAQEQVKKFHERGDKLPVKGGKGTDKGPGMLYKGDVTRVGWKQVLEAIEYQKV
ncbi:hypothetical protein IAT38_004288 [Cryptococcus sp. DSM 104549]